MTQSCSSTDTLRVLWSFLCWDEQRRMRHRPLSTSSNRISSIGLLNTVAVLLISLQPGTVSQLADRSPSRLFDYTTTVYTFRATQRSKGRRGLDFSDIDDGSSSLEVSVIPVKYRSEAFSKSVLPPPFYLCLFRLVRSR